MGAYRIVDIYVDDNFLACLDITCDEVQETKWAFDSILHCFDVFLAPNIDIEGDTIIRETTV